MIASIMLLALSSAPLVVVSGSSACPSGASVARHLERWLPARAADAEPDRASVDPENSGVRLVLRLADGTLVGEKHLEAGSSCDEIADAAAVIIAIWEQPLRPGVVPMLLGGTRDVEAAPMSPAPSQQREVPATAIHAERSQVVERDVPTTATRAEAKTAFPLEASLALREPWSGGVLGGMVEAALRRPSGLGARLGLVGATWREAPADAGSIAWTRIAADAGVTQRWETPRWSFELHGGVLSGVLVAKGRGYDDARSALAFAPGASAGARLGARMAHVRAWLELSCDVWPIVRELRVGGFADASVRPAVLEPALSLGLTFSSGR